MRIQSSLTGICAGTDYIPDGPRRCERGRDLTSGRGPAPLPPGLTEPSEELRTLFELKALSSPAPSFQRALHSRRQRGKMREGCYRAHPPSAAVVFTPAAGVALPSAPRC